MIIQKYLDREVKCCEREGKTQLAVLSVQTALLIVQTALLIVQTAMVIIVYFGIRCFSCILSFCFSRQIQALYFSFVAQSSILPFTLHIGIVSL